jgi:CubicO group peptidase (beta-lactamase class C family)
MKAMTTDVTTRELIDKLLNNIPALMEKHNVPGLSLALVRDAAILGSYAFGVRSNISHEPVTENTVFEAASLSKPVFAYAALKLCESGILDLDTPLTEYLPDPYVPDEPRLKLLTMRHVLSHTTGFPNWRPEGESLTMYFSPGERFSYSGEGYMYLQAVIAHVTGQEPAEYVRSKLLKPLGMGQSRFVWNGQDGLPIAIGHNEIGEATEKYLWQEMNAAASLHCTPRDYGNFLCVVMRPSSDNARHLSRQTTKEMLTAQVQVNDSSPWDDDWPKPKIKANILVGWGLGWGIQRASSGDSIWHWGNNGNYRAFTIGYPADGHGIVIMTNGKNGQKVINHILYETIGGDYPALDWLFG